MTITHPEPDIDGRLGIVVAELSGEVLRLRRQMDELRASLACEVHTARLVVSDGAHQSVEIRAGFVDVSTMPKSGDPESGSYLHLCSAPHAAVLSLSSGLTEPWDQGELSGALYVGSENIPSTAYLEVKAADDQREFAVALPEQVDS